jgi:choline dehydrogenase
VLVEKVIVVERGRATGIQFRRGGESRIEARCRGEVMLTAGSIGSTQILAALRHRPGDVACPHGIPVVKEKPGVGRNLQDHLQQRAIYKVQRRQDAERDLPGR